MEPRKGLDCIYIVGKGPTWSSAPSIFFKEHGDNEEIWGIGSVYRTHRNLDRIFIMHDPRQEVVFEDRDFSDSIIQYGKPVYTNADYEGINGLCKEFPIKAVMDSYTIRYFANTVSWMLAYAGTLEPKKVSLHGVDYRENLSHLQEKGCVEFWIGVLMERGIDVVVHPLSSLLKTTEPTGNVYGYIPLRERNGLINDYLPEHIDGVHYMDGTRPQILRAYKLVPVNHKEER